MAPLFVDILTFDIVGQEEVASHSAASLCFDEVADVAVASKNVSGRLGKDENK